MQRPPTIEQVAARAGVSRGTVSRVLNGDRGVSARRVEAVRTAVDELGYVPNRAARSLVTRRADAVALVFGGSPEGVLGHEFFARVVRGAHRVLADNDLQAVLVTWEEDAGRPAAERFLTAGHVDGALLLGLDMDDPLPARLAGLGVPAVAAGRSGGAASVVDVDNRGGARSAVDHLVAGGRRVVGTVAGRLTAAVGADRLAGWSEGLAAAGLEHGDDLVAVADFSRLAARDAVRALVERRPDLDAVFVASDPMAVSTLSELRRLGRRVPDDVAVVGFDGSVEGELADPPLTSVCQPLEELGALLASRLVADPALGRRPPAPDGSAPAPARLLGTHLVVRASSAPRAT